MINDLINKHLPKAFDNQLKDAVHDFTGSREGIGGEYDPIAGQYTDSSATSYSGRGTLSEYDSYEIQATQVDITDVKLSCLAAEVTDMPQIDDIIAIDGQERRVMNVMLSSTGVMVTMQLRGLYVG